MGKTKVYATTLGTVGCALAIGYFMQHEGQSPAQAATLMPEPVELLVLETAEPQPESPLALEDIKLTSVDVMPVLDDLTATPVSTVSFDPTAGNDVALVAPRDPEMPHLGCNVVVSARPAEMASVELRIEAPCNRNDRLTVHHTGMMFTQTTSDQGKLVVTVPALTETAVFILEFDNGNGAVAMADVPSLKDYDRVALQWKGDSGFQIHAREFGAAYGAKGHVWSGSAMLTSDTTGGVVTRMGELDTFSANMAEIYTFPRSAASRQGTVALTVEAEVTESNCGRDIAAQTIELRGTQGLRTQDLVLSVPDCSAIGDFLVLNNLVDDLKVAAR